VIHCEVLTGGNPALLDQEPYAERRDSRIDYSKIFGDQPESGSTPAKRARPASGSAKKPKANVTPAKQEAKTSSTPAKAVGGAIKTPKSGKKSGEQKTPKAVAVKKESAKKTNSPAVRTAALSPSGAQPAGSQKLSNDHKVRILAAPATPYHIDRTPQGGGGGGRSGQGADKSAAGYTCHTCGFTATRLNVIVLHSKTHSAPQASNNSRSNFAAATQPKSSPGGAKKPEKERPFRDDRVTSTSKPRKRDGKGAAAATSKARGAAAAAGGSAAKKARMTKKQREEKREQEERKEAERRRLLGDWSEDEHQEEEEYKKLQVSCSLLSSSSLALSTGIPYPVEVPSVADPGCLSRIRIFFHPGSQGQQDSRILYPHPHIRI
jgi:hypothetical protein